MNAFAGATLLPDDGYDPTQNELGGGYESAQDNPAEDNPAEDNTEDQDAEGNGFVTANNTPLPSAAAAVAAAAAAAHAAAAAAADTEAGPHIMLGLVCP